MHKVLAYIHDIVMNIVYIIDIVMYIVFIGIYRSYLVSELNIGFTGTIQKNEAIQPTASTNETLGKLFRLQSCVLLHAYRSI